MNFKYATAALIVTCLGLSACPHDLSVTDRPCDDRSGCPAGQRCHAGQCVAVDLPTVDAPVADQPGTRDQRPDKLAADMAPPDRAATPDVAPTDLPPPDQPQPDAKQQDAKSTPDLPPPDQNPAVDSAPPDSTAPDAKPKADAGPSILSGTFSCPAGSKVLGYRTLDAKCGPAQCIFCGPNCSCSVKGTNKWATTAPAVAYCEFHSDCIPCCVNKCYVTRQVKCQP